MLPAMTAAVLLARTQPRVLVGRRGRDRDAGEADRRGHAASRPLHPVAQARRERGEARARRVRAPLAVAALAARPGRAPLLDDARQRQLPERERRVAVRDRTAVRDDARRSSLCNLPITWTLPRAWRERKTLGRNDRRPVAVAGCRATISVAARPALLRPLLPPSVTATVPPHRRASLVRVAAGASSTRPGRGRIADRGADDGRGLLHAAVQRAAPSTSRSARTSRSSIQCRSTASSCGASVPEIYWASGARPATRFPITSALLTGYDATEPTEPGQPASNVRPEDGTPERLAVVLRGLRAAPAAVHPRRHPYSRMRGSQYYPISKYPEFAKIVYRDYKFVRAVDGFTIYERRRNAPPPVIPAAYVDRDGPKASASEPTWGGGGAF